jgi:hypothetical protein
MSRIGAEYIGRAIDKLRTNQTAGNIAAVFVADVTPADLDGVRWRFVVTDGSTADTIEAGISGSCGGVRGMAVDEGGLERLVEQRALNYAVETRLEDLLAASPLTLV